MLASDSGPTASAYLAEIGVRELPPVTAPFDPGYDPATVESHLAQSAHLMASLKISMAGWMVANPDATRRKTAAARRAGVATFAGGAPFEVAVAQGRLEAYLELCAATGLTGIEAGTGFTTHSLTPSHVLGAAGRHGLEVQFELGHKHEGHFTEAVVVALLEQGRAWLAAGARWVVVEARESAQGVGLFDSGGAFDAALAERFVEALGLESVVFEAPTKASQFAMIEHFGATVRLANVRLEELLRVEIYRRGLHSDAFGNPRLRPAVPPA